MRLPHRTPPLHVVDDDEFPPIANPKPCGCCRHGHAFVAAEITIRNRRTGVLVKRLTNVPGGFKETP